MTCVVITIKRKNIRTLHFSIRNKFSDQVTYVNQSPVWLELIDDLTDKPLVQGDVDLIFVEVSPWHEEREQQLQRAME